MAAPPITERHKHHFHRQSPILESVRCATTGNITTSTGLNAGDTIDGVTLADGDRVLVKDQSTGSQNGIYVAGATPARAYDQSTDDPGWGFLVRVRQGTANGDTLWANTNTSSPTIGSTSITFAEAGGGTSIAELDDIPDVNAPTPADQDVLTWDAGTSEWIAQAAPSGGASALDDLTDVDAPSPADGEVLTWDDGDGEWVSRSPLDTELVIVAAAGSAETIDVSVARTYQITLNDDCTFTLTGAVSTESWWVTIQVHQDSPGGYEITWPGSVNWPGDVAPTPPTDPPSVSVYTLWTFDGGTTWWGVLLASSGESFVADLDDLTDVTITTPAEGNALRYRSGVWVNEPLAATGGSLVTVDPGTPSYSVVGSNVEIAHDSVWGFDGTDPYYDSAGVVAGEEAALVYDFSDDTYSIIPYTPA